ncbi:YdiU family protein [Funiculus sociatus GB2-A5]|uniref:Protein nucleotidyltransferase YdiU n=1 Tax=Funiculus sociatus GB2-A5 TaxID=2933946 RepID=A0ABV0JS63_9CYAN|nr:MULTISPECIES: YdiU family protein [unclassified Trichocoleus]MBD1908038.1 YdiU family protein [Trichocoleus sp. FACHB-832]MBD2061594.1 YdiU family protein [Trichocoleus sp. FACHB-6]
MTPENSFNPFLNLNYDPALEALGDDFFDEVAAAEFPKHILRFRNDELLPKLGLKPEEVTDENFIEAFGKFQGRKPFLALRYHGYQFGEYNSRLGDGRGFLYGQVRGTDGELYDFGTKGSGTTPYSRGGDGRLTLKGGVREVLASEALYYLGVYTSRCLSMIETGDALWRGDEPSPTRSSVMVRFSRSHIRFGTFERLHNFGRKDLIQQLLDHVIVQYYPHLKDKQDRYALFYAELVQRVARLVAQWMSVGFCHAVLNTDNMSITGESFDYGPFAFIDTYNPQFTAAYFDYYGRYSYGNQPGICKLNLEMLQDPLSAVIPVEEMDIILKEFDEHYYQTYNERMLNKLGFANLAQPEAEELLMSTLTLLQKTQVGYHTFFSELTEQFNRNWRDDAANILKSDSFLNSSEATGLLEAWRNLYLQILLSLPESEMDNMLERLQRHNPKTVLLRPEIEAVWEKIDQEDNWEPFYQLISRLRFHQDAA